MKRALRVIIPILLVIVILMSLVWYLMEYDPGFTRDTIMATARTFDNIGHHKVAAWLYDLAYLQSRGGDDVAIELANHYKANGNYTKAEYTLSNAIADGGTVDLYIALCQTYVEQDKLLDAVEMLDNIGNPEIKAQIDKIRPAAPTLSPDPNFYNKDITVTVDGGNNAVYVNYEGHYPSTETDLFTEPVTLPRGETSIYAVAVNENNIVSTLTIEGYTIVGVIEEIQFKDEALEAFMRSELNFGNTRPFNSDDLWGITTLTIPEGVTTYEDLYLFPYLEELIIPDCGTIDLTPITKLPKLTTLTIRKGELNLDSMKAIGAMTGLTSLTLTNCGLSTVAHFDGLVNLKYLDLNNNTLRNIGVFSSYVSLEELHMSSNALTDLDALTGLKALTVLDVSHNSLQSISPILGLTELNTLLASNNAITEIEGIGALVNLEILDLSQNGLKELSPLAGCTKLVELTLSNNVISDISVLTQITSIVRLDVSHNKIEELPEFTSKHELGSIIISYNLLKDIDELSVLPDLYSVDIDYNAEVDSLDPLIDSHHLILVNCYGTKIVRSPFSGDSVVVNLDPSLYYDE